MENATIKKLLFQASHRGMKEADFLIGGFVRMLVDTLSLDAFLAIKAEIEAFLDLPDQVIFDALWGQGELPSDYEALFKRFREFAGSVTLEDLEGACA